MPVYKIRDPKSEKEWMDLIEASIGVRPKSITMSILIEISEVEFEAPLTSDQEKTLYRELAKFDMRIDRKVDKP